MMQKWNFLKTRSYNYSSSAKQILDWILIASNNMYYKFWSIYLIFRTFIKFKGNTKCWEKKPKTMYKRLYIFLVNKAFCFYNIFFPWKLYNFPDIKVKTIWDFQKLNKYICVLRQKTFRNGIILYYIHEDKTS